MELPQTVEWAVHCCWLLAQTDGSPVPRRRLAEFFDLPEPYLAKLLKALVGAEVLSSVPGVNGGYRLARPAGQITVLDRPQLEELCCECYAVVKKETDRLLPDPHPGPQTASAAAFS